MTADSRMREVYGEQIAKIDPKCGAREFAQKVADAALEALRIIAKEAREAGIRECMAVAENVCFRATEDERSKDGRVRCSVDDLTMKLTALIHKDQT